MLLDVALGTALSKVRYPTLMGLLTSLPTLMGLLTSLLREDKFIYLFFDVALRAALSKVRYPTFMGSLTDF